MRHTFLTALFLSFIFSGKSQVTYHNYLDCSSEWRYYVYTYQFGPPLQQFVTKYLDGDTLINGQYYYHQKTVLRNLGSTTVSVSSGLFLREDSNKNFIVYSPITNNEDTVYKFLHTNNLIIGDSLTIGSNHFFTGDFLDGYYSKCLASKIDSFMFGTRMLKAVCGVDTMFLNAVNTFPGIVEGIGSPYPHLCNFGCCDAVPVPYLYYYKRGSDQITFNTTSFIYSLDSFPTPVRTYICTLPLRLLSFTTKLQTTNTVLLNWQTANEINISHINIQRSINNKSFESIGKINASCCEYNFTDDKLPLTHNPLTLNYRLEIVDKDGSKTYSTTQQITIKPQTPNITIYPNPAKDVVTIECSNATEILILDYSGKTIKRYNNITQPQTLNTKQLTKGVYVVRAILKDGNVRNEKLVVE